MKKHKKWTTSVILVTFLGVLLMAAGVWLIALTSPIMIHIGDLAKIDELLRAFLWTILMMFIWAIGVCMFFMGIMVAKAMDDDETPEEYIQKNSNIKIEKDK